MTSCAASSSPTPSKLPSVNAVDATGSAVSCSTVTMAASTRLMTTASCATGSGSPQSMGTVGDSSDSTMAESCWASLKRELVAWSRFVTHAEVFESINWYNHEQLHTSLQMQSAHDVEQTLTRPLLAA